MIVLELSETEAIATKDLHLYFFLFNNPDSDESFLCRYQVTILTDFTKWLLGYVKLYPVANQFNSVLFGVIMDKD